MEDDTIEYEEYEVVDFKKIGLFATMIVLGGILVAVYIGGVDFPTIDLPEKTVFNANEQNTHVQDQRINSEYRKYIDLGISEDDILNIQELPCEAFESPENLSTDPKYELIFNQRQSDCGL